MILRLFCGPERWVDVRASEWGSRKEKEENEKLQLNKYYIIVFTTYLVLWLEHIHLAGYVFMHNPIKEIFFEHGTVGHYFGSNFYA